MIKRTILALLLAVVCVGANAQFEKKTKYLNASLTGLDLNYSKNSRFHLGFEATAGYFVKDSWMIDARAGLNHQVVKAAPDETSFELGAGFRYYFKSCGIFLGSGVLYDLTSGPKPTILGTMAKRTDNHVLMPVEAGYCFYVNHYISIEPALYYNICLDDFKDASRVGLRLGLGFYF